MLKIRMTAEGKPISNRRIRPLCHLSGGFYSLPRRKEWNNGFMEIGGLTLGRRRFDAAKPEFLFVIRNAKQSAANFALASWTMHSILRGERSGSGRLPELRRYWICCEARGLERKVRRGRVYPLEMSRLRGRRPETPNPTFDRRLTARPVVLAKTFGTGPSHFPSIWLTVRAARFRSNSPHSKYVSWI
jgi:hypothetical protein